MFGEGGDHPPKGKHSSWVVSSMSSTALTWIDCIFSNTICELTLVACSKVNLARLGTNTCFSSTGTARYLRLGIELAFSPLISIPPHL